MATSWTMAISVSGAWEQKLHSEEYEPAWIRGEERYCCLSNNPIVADTPQLSKNFTKFAYSSPPRYTISGSLIAIFCLVQHKLCLIWPQHGPQEAIRLHLLLSGCSQGVSAHQSSPIAALGQLLPGHVPAHGSTQGFGNGKCKHRQREIIAAMSMAAMGWEAGYPSEFSRDPEALT